MSVIVLSTSNVKQIAFEKSKLYTFFKNIKFVSVDDIIKTNNFKCLPSQPVNNSGKICANIRIDYYEKVFGTKDMVIAIENYVLDTSGDDTCSDICHVAVSFNGKRYDYSSVDCQKCALFPTKYFKSLGEINTTSYAASGYDITIGQLVMNDTGIDIEKLKNLHNASSTNWIRIFNEFDRVEQIVETLNLINFEDIVKDQILKHHDFPKPGITFKNILPLFSNAFTQNMLIELSLNKLSSYRPDYVIGLESRGFIFGAILANKLNCGFVPIRKAGKLPDNVYSVEYKKEYGSDKFEISKYAIPNNTNILIVDDLLATGGTFKAALDLVANFKPKTIKLMVIDTIVECYDMAKATLGNYNMENHLFVVL